MSYKKFLKHEYEQIKHIDSDADGQKYENYQSFYDKLENLQFKNNTSMMIMNLFLIS